MVCQRDHGAATVADVAGVWHILDGIRCDPVLRQAVFQERADEAATVVVGLLADVSALEKSREVRRCQFADVPSLSDFASADLNPHSA